MTTVVNKSSVFSTTKAMCKSGLFTTPNANGHLGSVLPF
jgi:hypothetical protein